MDDTAILDAVREADPATAETVAERLDADPAVVEARLGALASAGRVAREDDGWRLARDPRLDSSAERMADRLGSERR